MAFLRPQFPKFYGGLVLIIFFSGTDTFKVSCYAREYYDYNKLLIIYLKREVINGLFDFIVSGFCCQLNEFIQTLT